jgi:hypothetical protein
MGHLPATAVAVPQLLVVVEHSQLLTDAGRPTSTRRVFHDPAGFLRHIGSRRDQVSYAGSMDYRAARVYERTLTHLVVVPGALAPERTVLPGVFDTANDPAVLPPLDGAWLLRRLVGLAKGAEAVAKAAESLSDSPSAGKRRALARDARELARQVRLTARSLENEPRAAEPSTSAETAATPTLFG